MIELKGLVVIQSLLSSVIYFCVLPCHYSVLVPEYMLTTIHSEYVYCPIVEYSNCGWMFNLFYIVFQSATDTYFIIHVDSDKN